mmetsp:Transcript_28713/g.55889  ORF Transcript_28713/g.55889 Transcript_28713/m.55889 type:complete len:208 (-) Transcript_28713:277-900(-)
MIEIASLSVGSATKTDWKRRARAPSFSMCWRYSFRVVAPMKCSSPRARAGLIMFDASIDPPTAPAPTRVWSSSTKRMMLPSFSTSFRTPLNLSSNSPRCDAPAISNPRSSESTRLPRIVSGTSPSMMRWARPSTIAVLPTPGSPINTGLFFVLLDRISTALFVSVYLPITGSSLPCFALAVRSIVYFFRFSPAGNALGSTHARPPPC